MNSEERHTTTRIIAAGTYYSHKFEYVNQKLRQHFQLAQDEMDKVKEHVNELVTIVHNDNKDWSIKKISEYIAGKNDDLEEFGFSSRTIYNYLNIHSVVTYVICKKSQKNVTEDDDEGFHHNVIEDSSTMNAREFTKQHYQRAHRNMSKSEVDKIFEEIPQDLDFDNITPTDLNAALTKANESVINKDYEEAETRLKRFDILMKEAATTTKDQKVDKKKPEPKPKNKNIVSKKYELKYKDQTIPLICLFFYDSESFTITVDE